MKVLIGTYRADKVMIGNCIGSLENYVPDAHDLLFVDDSGDADFRKWLESFGDVHWVGTGSRGYAKAMRVVSELMREGDDDYYCFWEEDFTATAPIVLSHLADELDNDPTLAQIVLPRQPWYPNEIERGDIITAMSERLQCPVVGERGVHETLWVHKATFSTNPAVWAPMAYRWSWPQVENSEEEKTRYLVDDDEASFAFYGFTPKVKHDGERQGHGY